MSKKKVEVVIGGNILSLQGDETEDHIQKVARVINEKLNEIQAAYEKSHLPASKVNQLLILNIADAYVKKDKELDTYRTSLEEVNTSLKEVSTSLEEVNVENEGLKEEVKALRLQMAQMKEASVAKESTHKKDHTNRGR